MHTPDPEHPEPPAVPSPPRRTDPLNLPPANGSTGSHRPQAASSSSLSDLLRANAGMSRRAGAAADFAAHLMGPGGLASAPVSNSDDAPTIITPSQQAAPSPPYVVGESPALAGRRLGHFELIEAIGAGGMAAVLRARDDDLGREVALKILPPESALDAETVTRFKQEARAAAKLDHDNVARVYFCGEDQGLHFIAFEFVEGTNLRRLIDKRGRLPAGECVGYMIQVAAGLAHASERGVVHRDIKPSNIVITPDGRAKIVDMGLARHLDSNPVNGGVTQSGVTLGTFDYISPEQALDPRRADVRSDLYSLGCTFYHALTGRPPVPEGTAAKKLYSHQHIDPIDPRDLNPAVPDAVAAVLARMMAKDPARRYQTPAELIADLKRLIDPLLGTTDFTLSDSVIQSIPASDSVLPRPPHVPIGLVLTLVAVVLVVAAFSLTSSNGHLPPPPWATETAGKKTGTPSIPGTDPGTAAAKTSRGGFVAAATAEQLAEALADPKTTHVRLTGNHYDLSPLTEGVVFRGEAGHKLRVDNGGPGRPPVEVRVAAVPLDAGSADRPGTLTFVGGDAVEIEGLCFVTVKSPADGEGPVTGAGLAAVDVGSLTLTDCQFDLDKDLGAAEAAPLAVGRTGGEIAPKVILQRCLFHPGAVGVRLCPRTKLTVKDSAFGPQRAAVQVRADDFPAAGADGRTSVLFSRSSFMLDPRSAAVEAGGTCDVEVRAWYCAFAPTGPTADAPPPGTGSSVRHGVVVRVIGDKLDRVAYSGDPEGRRNVYYRVDALGQVTETAEKTFSFDECRDLKVPVEDKVAVTLKRLPWAASDFATASKENPYHAFRLRRDPEVFVSDETAKVVGARFAANPAAPGLVYEGSAPIVPPVVSADPRRKVWWPDAPKNEPRDPGVYADFEDLLLHVRSGDEILIRADGAVLLDPQSVKYRRGPTDDKAAEFAVAFRPFEEPGHTYRPILTATPGGLADDALFTLVDGDVTFSNLQFRVTAGNPKGVGSRAVVSILGAKSCEFRNCTITLDEDGSKAAAVALADLERLMGMPPGAARPVPHVGFENSLVRGKGRLLWVPSSRPFDLDVTNSVAALDGPVLEIDPSARNGDDAHSRVRFKRVTALLGGPVLDLQAGKAGEGGTGLVPTQFEADECLFAAVPNAGRPLIQLDGVDPNAIESVVAWSRPKTATRPNWYANFDPSAPVVAFNRPAEGMPAKAWNWNDWLHFGDRSAGRPIGKVTFAAGPTGAQDLSGVKPADAAVKEIEFPEMTGLKASDAGANVDKLTPPTE